MTKSLSAAQYLICSAEASADRLSALRLFWCWISQHPKGAVTAVITNPLWLVRVRMFATTKESPGAYKGLWGVFMIELTHLVSYNLLDGLSTIAQSDGVTGLFRGTALALVGVSNGAIQFVAYEKMKEWGFDQKRKQAERAGKTYSQDLDKLVRTTFGMCKLLLNSYSLI